MTTALSRPKKDGAERALGRDQPSGPADLPFLHGTSQDLTRLSQKPFLAGPSRCRAFATGVSWTESAGVPQHAALAKMNKPSVARQLLGRLVQKAGRKGEQPDCGVSRPCVYGLYEDRSHWLGSHD
jgi:hypothetical protein